jgi:hypothetical protein
MWFVKLSFWGFGISGKTGISPRSFRLHITPFSLFCGILKCSVLRITALNVYNTEFVYFTRNYVPRISVVVDKFLTFSIIKYLGLCFSIISQILKKRVPRVSSNPFEIGLTERLAVVHNCIFHDITIVVFNLKIIHGYFGRLSFVISNGAYHT